MLRKTTHILTVILTLTIVGCKDDPASPSNTSTVSDIINDEFPEAKQEVMETFGEIAQSIVDGDVDKLISYHANGSKFTEFKNGEPRNGGDANETYERNVFGSVAEAAVFNSKEVLL